MRIVVALGGNALLQRGQSPDAGTQEANVRTAVASIAALSARHELVVTHGNGPQVGVLAVESAGDPALNRPYPLDVLGAETEGMVGYWLQRELASALPGRRVVTLLTLTLVNGDDPAFLDPQKFIGQVYDCETAHRVAEERGWVVKPDGDYWRRVVASPQPVGIVELTSIRALVGIGTIVICAGGGGVPVVATAAGLHGVEAVVDKDRASALLAHQLDADALLMLTDVDAVQLDFGTPTAEVLRSATSAQLRELTFPAGSMGPKIEAACDFVDGGGRFAAIGALGDALALAEGAAGTIVTRALARADREPVG